jgi:hypothetical protein
MRMDCWPLSSDQTPTRQTFPMFRGVGHLGKFIASVDSFQRVCLSLASCCGFEFAFWGFFLAFTTTRSFTAIFLQKGRAILLHQCLSVSLCFCFVSFEPDIESGASLGLAQGTSRPSFVVPPGNRFYCILIWIGSETFTVFFSFWIGQRRFSLFEIWSTRNLLDPGVSTCVGGIGLHGSCGCCALRPLRPCPQLATASPNPMVLLLLFLPCWFS